MKRANIVTAAAAAMLAGLTLVGCGSKDQKDAAATPTHDAPNPAPGSNVTPTTPDKAADTATQNMGSQLKAMGQDAKDLGSNASNMLSAEKQKAQDKMGSTTMPSVGHP